MTPYHWGQPGTRHIYRLANVTQLIIWENNTDLGFLIYFGFYTFNSIGILGIRSSLTPLKMKTSLMKYVIFTLSTLLWDLASLSKIFLLSLSGRLENPSFPVYQHSPEVPLPFRWFKVPLLWPWPPLLFFCIHRNRNCRTKKYVGLHFW